MAQDMAWIDELLGSPEQDDEEEPIPWHLGVFDSHCHPTDTPSCISHIPNMKARALTVMATRGEDQDVVAKFAEQDGTIQSTATPLPQDGPLKNAPRIIPSFGWHPWFSHQIYDDSSLGTGSVFQEAEKIQHYKAVIAPVPDDDEFLRLLPDPRSLSGLLDEIQSHLRRFPGALVGEIGLDRTFRLPENWIPNVHTQLNDGVTPGGREGRRLSPYRVHMDHQRKILKAQLSLAGEMRRPVSVHGVAAHGVLFETIRESWKGYEREVVSKREQKQRETVKRIHAEDAEADQEVGADDSPKPFPPRICLHSYSGPPDTLREYFHPSVPASIYCSFSVLVNLKPARSKKTIEVIKAVPDDRILVESDLHCAGDHMDRLLEKMVRCVCKAKAWCLEQGVNRLASNWSHFVYGNDIAGDEPISCSTGA